MGDTSIPPDPPWLELPVALRGLPDSGERLGCLAQLCQCRGRGGDCNAKHHFNVPRSPHREGVLGVRVAFRPVPLEEAELTRSLVRKTDAQRELRRLSKPGRLCSVLGGLGESAEFSEAADQKRAVVDGYP